MRTRRTRRSLFEVAQNWLACGPGVEGSLRARGATVGADAIVTPLSAPAAGIRVADLLP